MHQPSPSLPLVRLKVARLELAAEPPDRVRGFTLVGGQLSGEGDHLVKLGEG